MQVQGKGRERQGQQTKGEERKQIKGDGRKEIEVIGKKSKGEER